MTNHALERLFQRYGKELTYWDLRNIIHAIKSGKCYVLDATVEDRLIVLVNYNHIPMKIVYSAGEQRKGVIVTALPLDVDEWNNYISQIPEVIVERKNKNNS